jgi:site-specific DNA recombinase
MPELKNAVGYVRCSTEMQEDSPDQQKREIEKFAASSGYSISEWFEDFGESGTSFERPGFQRLLKKVESGVDFRAVIIYDESRWGRAIDAEENTYWRVHFRRFNVDVVLVKTSIDPNHEFAPMLNAFEGIQASQYSKKLSDLTFRGSSNNGVYSSGGTAPYGYGRVAVNLITGAIRDLDDGARSVRYQEKVKWKIGNPAEVEIVKRIFQRRISGVACVLIAKELNEEGIPCSKRGRWRSSDQKWSSSTIKSILENESYYGARTYNKNSMSKIRAKQSGRDKKKGIRFPHWVNSQSDWIVVENAHPGIISKETWMNANATEERPKIKRNNHALNSNYLLTGLIRCSRCGFPFQGQTQKTKGHVYPKYIDGGWQAKRVCSYIAIPKGEIETFAFSAIRETLTNPDVVRRVELLIDQMSQSKKVVSGAALSSLSKELKTVEKKKENILETLSLADNEQMRKALLEKLSSLDSEQGKINIKISSAKSQIRDERDYLSVAQSVREFMLNIETVFNNAPIYERKEIFRRCISKILVDREQNVVRLFVRTLPSLQGLPQEPFKIKSPLTDELVSGRSSGART